MDLLVRHIGRLHTMSSPMLTEAAVSMKPVGSHGLACGTELPNSLGDLAELDVEGRVTLPGFVDAHTHLVWAGTRREEFVARSAGMTMTAGGSEPRLRPPEPPPRISDTWPKLVHVKPSVPAPPRWR